MKNNKEIEILHVDMDAFFASVEKKDNPDLKDKPVIVGGTGLGSRGVVSAACYLARKYGVHSAMPIVRARQLCPQGIYLPVRQQRYAEISAKIFTIFKRYTPLVEKLSIDEAFLDLSGCHGLYGSSIEIAKGIKREIKEEIDLTASVGLAANKFLAKLASDLEKPNGFVLIEPEKVEKILDPLSVDKIFGIGQKTKEKLQNKGIKSIRQLKKLSINDLQNLFGKNGRVIYNLARGIDNRAVEPGNKAKSISNEITFSRDLWEKEDLLAVLVILCEKVVHRLRKKKMKANTVFLKLRFDNFQSCSRSKTLKNPVDNTGKIYSELKKILLTENLIKSPVRLMGMGVANLTKQNRYQMSLFDKTKKIESEEEISLAVEKIKDRYGEDSIMRARALTFKKDKSR